MESGKLFLKNASKKYQHYVRDKTRGRKKYLLKESKTRNILNCKPVLFNRVYSTP